MAKTTPSGTKIPCWSGCSRSLVFRTVSQRRPDGSRHAVGDGSLLHDLPSPELPQSILTGVFAPLRAQHVHGGHSPVGPLSRSTAFPPVDARRGGFGGRCRAATARGCVSSMVCPRASAGLKSVLVGLSMDALPRLQDLVAALGHLRHRLPRIGSFAADDENEFRFAVWPNQADLHPVPSP